MLGIENNVFTTPMFWVLIGGMFVVLLAIIVFSFRRLRSTREIIRMGELDLERKKLELMAKRMLIDDLKSSARKPSDSERETIDAIKMDSSVLTKKILHTMEEMDNRAKRLELGTDTAKLLKTLRELKDEESKLFGKRTH